MREILFRGLTDDKKMVYGNFLADALEGTNDLVSWGFIKYYDKNYMKSVIVEINRNTLGQYTGLCDKNGNKLFEGDLMKWTSIDTDGSLMTKIDEIKWSKYGWVCGKESQCLADYLLFDPSYENLELFGNIHEVTK